MFGACSVTITPNLPIQFVVLDACDFNLPLGLIRKDVSETLLV
jgi:hypothetical protein